MQYVYIENGKCEIEKYKEIIQNVLPLYNIIEAELSVLSCWDNIVFRVASTHDFNSYVFRIHSIFRHTRDELVSELLWLSYLNKKLGQAVPGPVLNQNNQLITEAYSEDLAKVHYCSLLSWVEGEVLTGQISLKTIQAVGKLMAKLHLASLDFKITSSFTRSKLDTKNLEYELSILEKGVRQKVLQQSSFDLLKNKVHEAIKVMNLFGEDKKFFGLIHGDLYQSNYLIFQDKIHAIDFDCCAFGYYIYDMAITLWWHQSDENFLELKQALIASYTQEFSIHYDYIQDIDVFLAVRSIYQIGYLIRDLDDERKRESLQEIIDFSLSNL